MFSQQPLLYNIRKLYETKKTEILRLFYWFIQECYLLYIELPKKQVFRQLLCCQQSKR